MDVFSLFQYPLGSVVCLPHLLQEVLLGGWHLLFIPRSWSLFSTLRFSLHPVHYFDFTESDMFSWQLSLWVLLSSSVMVTLGIHEGRGQISPCRLGESS